MFLVWLPALIQQAVFPGPLSNPKDLAAMDPIRDDKGHFLPGKSPHPGGRTPQQDKRLATWRFAKRLAEQYPTPLFEEEINPASMLLYLFMRGALPGITDKMLEEIDALPTAEQRWAARAVAMMSVDHRIECLKAVTGYMLPKLTATEIKNTGAADIVSMADVAVNDPETRDLLEKVALRQSKLRREAAEAAAKAETGDGAPGGTHRNEVTGPEWR
jgi:hypothetical protein